MSKIGSRVNNTVWGFSKEFWYYLDLQPRDMVQGCIPFYPKALWVKFGHWLGQGEKNIIQTRILHISLQWPKPLTQKVGLRSL